MFLQLSSMAIAAQRAFLVFYKTAAEPGAASPRRAACFQVYHFPWWSFGKFCGGAAWPPARSVFIIPAFF